MEFGGNDGENAWSTALTTISSRQTNDGDSNNNDDEQAAVTVPTEATQSSVEDANPSTPPAVTAHTRGLTSTLSGRRQRYDSLAAQDYQSSSPASTAPDTDNPYSRAYSNMYESQVLSNTPPRRDSNGQWRGRQPQPVGRQQANPVASPFHDDSPPPDSFLVEVRGSPSPPPSGTGQAVTEPQAQRNAGGSSRHAGQSRPVQRQRSGHRGRKVFGDGRMFSIAEEHHSQNQQQHRQPQAPLSQSTWRAGRRGRRRTDTKLTYKERALQAWRDSRHLDEFFGRVYTYYIGKGALNIILSRVLHLATLAFVVALSTFVFGCVDHKLVREQKSLSAVVIPQCTSKFSWPATIFLWAFVAFWVAQLVRTVMDVPALLEIRAFFTEALDVSPADINTVAWHEIVSRMVKLRDAEINQYKDMTKSRVLGYRLTADNIVNRIMRRENYMIALFNKDVLDLRIPGLGSTPVLTKALEWNLSFCLMSYLFDDRGQLRRRFLKESNRDILSEGLRRRLKFMAVINLVFAPFIVIFLMLYGFFRYFEEVYHEPGTITSRAFTPLARWKFRNFNEVPHSFRRRIHMAHPKATLYLAQFKNEAVISLARFVTFIAGSFTALLILFTVVDNELSLEFEITRHRTVLFYLGLFGTVLAAARGMVPDDEQERLHPAWIIHDVLEDLQYMEPAWRGKLDTTKVRQEFETLFDYKLAIFVHELLGVITAPFIMLVSLPRSAEKVIDMFREFSVHVDHLGYVCSFAIFDFERNGNVNFSAPARTANAHLASKNGKMEQSFLHFKAEYPDWEPRDQAGSIYLQRAQNVIAQQQQQQQQQRQHQQHQQEMWRVGSLAAGSAAGWQARLLQQQRMAGSVFPTGASIYKQRATQQGTTGKSQYPFRPFAQNIAQSTMASQAMLPFGPTLGGAGTAAPIMQQGQTGSSSKGKEPDRGDAMDSETADRLALSALPLVASPEMGNSLNMSMYAGERPAGFGGILSIVNQLYEQQML